MNEKNDIGFYDKLLSMDFFCCCSIGFEWNNGGQFIHHVGANVLFIVVFFFLSIRYFLLLHC